PPANADTALTKKPKLGSAKSRNRDIPEGLWIKCPKCDAMVLDKELDEHLKVCPNRQHHFRIGARERVHSLLETCPFHEVDADMEKALPVIIISSSGGARMYEGMFSLLQMAKTCGALAYHAKSKLPYISVLTDPTTAGVMASFASVGDLILAEPGAMIGFAGPRVIKDTTQAELPPGFQTAEFLLEHGLIDAIVPRKEMKERLGFC